MGAGGGASPLYGLCRYVLSQRVGFSAILVINRVSILAVIAINRVWFLHPGVEMGLYFRSYFLISKIG